MWATTPSWPATLPILYEVRLWGRAAPVTLLQGCHLCPGGMLPATPQSTGTQAVLQQSAGSQEAGQIAPATLPITGRWSAVHPLNADLSP